jgi:hypothetical protein
MTEIIERRIRRCVDRELSAEVQHTLLSELDRLADGWKRLSLALLEDRTVADVCRADQFQQPELDMEPLRVVQSSRPAQVVGASLVTTALALLAPIGTSFVLGRWTVDGSGDDIPIADEAVRPTDSGDGSQSTAESGSGSFVTTEANDESPPELLQLLLELDLGAGQVRSIPVSVLSADEWRQRATANAPPLLPSHFRQSLLQSGYAVDERKELMLFPLDDSRHLSMPVETVLVRESP